MEDELALGAIASNGDFEAAIDVVENPTTTNAELAAIKVIVNDAVTLQEAEAQVGVNVIAKLVKKQLVSRGSLAAGAVGASMAATELAKLISRLF